MKLSKMAVLYTSPTDPTLFTVQLLSASSSINARESHQRYRPLLSPWPLWYHPGGAERRYTNVTHREHGRQVRRLLGIATHASGTGTEIGTRVRVEARRSALA